MPLIYKKPLEPEGELGVWEVLETEDWFRRQFRLSEPEAAQLARIKGRRRLDWLAARQLVHIMSGRTERGAFRKDEHGKPHLEGADWMISISHSGNVAAAIASPLNVGIDIQHPVAKIYRLAPKFLRPEELDSLATGDNRLGHLHVYWGAKEALYKAYGRRQLDFRTHIGLEPFAFPPVQGCTHGWVHKDEYEGHFQVHYGPFRGYMLVYVMQE